jgi:MYXO-CTERM domain-containing protein
VRVPLVPGDVIGNVCFAGLVRDTTGKISNSAAQEVCVKTVTPPFFRGCSVAPGVGGGREVGWAWAGVLLVLGTRRRPHANQRKSRDGDS